MSDTLLLRNLRPWAGAPTNPLIERGRIASLSPALPAPPGAAVEDCGGVLAFPGLVEAHTHFDKTLWGMPWYRNEVGPRLIDKTDNERRMRPVLGMDAARQSARQVVQSVRMGSTHIRSHVDVDTEVGLAGIEGVMATRERHRGSCDIKIVTFLQSGSTAGPPPAGRRRSSGRRRPALARRRSAAPARATPRIRGTRVPVVGAVVCSKLRKPASAMVGTSGRSGLRSGVEAANALVSGLKAPNTTGGLG